MPHEIAIINGKPAMMFVGKTPWHTLGTKFETPPKTADEVIRAAGLDWEVGLKPVYVFDGAHFCEFPQYQATVRLDLWGKKDCVPFGLVGTDYADANRQAFEFFEPLVSTAAILTVIVPPSITVQPQSKIALGGSNVTLTAFASGTTPLTYQWIKNGEKIASATLFSLLLPSVRRTNSGSYALIVTNIAGVVTSATANLTVHVPQKIQASLDSNGPIFTSHDADGGRLFSTNLSQFRLQISSNLLQWVTVSNALSITNGELRVTLPVGSNQMQFHRIFELW